MKRLIKMLENEILRIQAQAESRERRARELQIMAETSRGEIAILEKRIEELKEIDKQQESR